MSVQLLDTVHIALQTNGHGDRALLLKIAKTF
jgi:hypothetical protein